MTLPSSSTSAPHATLEFTPVGPATPSAQPLRELAEHAQRLGFVRWGVADASAQHGAHQRFADWIARDYHGQMQYLERPRAEAQELLPGARSVIVVALSYGAAQTRAEPQSVAAYARGSDYHFVLKDKLRQLAQACAQVLGVPLRARVCVDTAPLLERAWAQRAGVGFTGKSTLSIAPGIGSCMLLGELILDVELPASQPLPDGCGSCRACLDACPTRAFVDAYTLDARRCISYLTIEFAGSIPRELRPLIGQRVFGCDECQRVCPYNESRKLPPPAPEFLPRSELELDPAAILALTSSGYRRWVKGSARARTSRKQLQRNAAVALGNRGALGDVQALADALLGNPYPLVRSHAAWALGHLGTPQARAALQRAELSETDPETRSEIAQALHGQLAPPSASR